jgi:cell division control protein 7
MTWSQFVEKLNPNLMVPRKESLHLYPHCKPGEATLAEPPLSSSPFSSHSSSVAEPVKSSYRVRQRSFSPIAVSEETHKAEIALALDLLEKMLNPDATRRIQPRNALAHPFLSEEAEGIYDDDAFPHAFGGGVCGDLHYYDDDTGDACVQLPQEDGSLRVKRVLPGEGLAIGNSPCEFHSHLDVPC